MRHCSAVVVVGVKKCCTPYPRMSVLVGILAPTLPQLHCRVIPHNVTSNSSYNGRKAEYAVALPYTVHDDVIELSHASGRGC